MKKVLSFLLVSILLVGVLALAGCGGGGQDENLVGTWEWELLGDDLYYTFNDDGTGHFNIFGDVSEFSWTTSGEQLRINRTGDIPSGEIRNERWNYTINGNRLTIESRQEDDLILDLIRR